MTSLDITLTCECKGPATSALRYLTPHGPNIGRYCDYQSRNSERRREFRPKKIMPPAVLSSGTIAFARGKACIEKQPPLFHVLLRKPAFLGIKCDLRLGRC